MLPLNLEQDSYIRTAEFRPGNRRVVHHGVIYVDESGAARRLAANSPDGSYPCFGGPRVAASGLLAGWAPGTITEPGDPQLSIPVKTRSSKVPTRCMARPYSGHASSHRTLFEYLEGVDTSERASW